MGRMAYMVEQTKSIEKLPPQDTEAEKSLLGSLLIDPDAILKVVDFLLPRDFYKAKHQQIYGCMLDMFEKREPIDVLSISSKLKGKNQLEGIGGASYLTTLINTVPTATHILNYAKIVQQKRVLRELINAGHKINELANNEDEDVDTLLDKAEKTIFDIAQKSLTQRFVSVKEMIDDTWKRIDELSKQTGELRGVATGFKSLDNLLAGLQKSDLVILAARPSLGKSSLAINIAQNVAIKKKIPVGIFSLEMSKDQIMDRILSSEADIDSWRLRTGKLSDQGEHNDFTRLQTAMGTLADAPIYIDDTSGLNILQMRAMARRLYANNGLGLLIVDYLQLMSHRNSQLNILHQVTENSKALKGLAKELNIPVLVLSQLSRAVEQRTPQIPRLSDLRESGGIEQDADVVMMIHREDRYKENSDKPNIAEIIIAKHRNGPVGKVELYFDETRTTFRDLEKGFTPPSE